MQAWVFARRCRNGTRFRYEYWLVPDSLSTPGVAFGGVRDGCGGGGTMGSAVGCEC